MRARTRDVKREERERSSPAMISKYGTKPDFTYVIQYSIAKRREGNKVKKTKLNNAVQVLYCILVLFVCVTLYVYVLCVLCFVVLGLVFVHVLCVRVPCYCCKSSTCNVKLASPQEQ